MIYIVITYLHLFFTKFKNKTLLLVSFLVLWLLCGLRNLIVGTDTEAYFNHYQLVLNGGRSYKELLWDQLLLFSSFFNFSFNEVLLLSSFLTLVPVFYVSYKKSKHPILSIFFYLSLYYYFYSFNIIRQMIAVSWILFFYYFFEKKNIKFCILSLVIAFLFHKSAIIAPLIILPIWFLKKHIYKIRYFFIIFSIVVGLFFEKYLNVFIHLIYKDYGIDSETVDVYASLMKVLIMSMLFVFIDQIYKKRDCLWFWIFYANIIILNLMIRIPFANRLTHLFGIGQLVFLVLVFENVKKSKKNKLLVSFLFIIYASAIFISKYGSGDILPYRLLDY